MTEESTVVRKISLALGLMLIAGSASASQNQNDICASWLAPLLGDYCTKQSGPAQAPEIDPASAMAGLTLLAGGLAVLRGRRTKKA